MRIDAGNSTLAITYKDDGNQDGICSQLLRIYGVYAISRDLGIPYFHSPIAHLGYHGLAALENNAPFPDLLAAVNRAFQIPSDIELPHNRVVVHDMIDADVEGIARIKNAGSRDHGVDLIRILYPFPLTDSNPELYRSLKTVCPFPYRRSDVFRLAIHVRRGDLFAVDSDWMLPNSYYVSCVLRFQNVLRKLDIPFVCELYTEVSSKTFEVTPHHHGINGRIAENVIIAPSMNHLEDFDAIPKLERFINFDPVESLRRMTTADALIISHSSFSYLPAVFNSNRIVVYNPYWRGRMKDWLVADNDGVFPESDLINRLEGWKRALTLDSAASISRVINVPRPNLYPEIERLLRPFREQSAEIRAVVTAGRHQILGETEESTPLRLVVDEKGVPSVIRAETIGTDDGTLGSLARQVGPLSGASRGEDLLLIPAHLLSEMMPPPTEEFGFRSVAALYPRSNSYGDSWRLRRTLFDCGFICVGSVDFAGGYALCFLASDAVRSFNNLDVDSRGYITMPSLPDGAGFGNQLWRYACVKLYALRHGLTPAFPAWQGNQLFGLEDKSCEGLKFPRISYPGFANNDRELWDQDDPPINIDLSGFFQEIPTCWRKHRELLRHMFELSPEHAQAIDSWRDKVTDGGHRTLVAISVRRGDYLKFQFQHMPWFRIVPEEWYLDWLRTIWPTLIDPVLFVASDEPDEVVPVFEEFEPVAATFEGSASELPHHVSDFEVLRRADYVAICNSSFPRFAAILAESSQKCFLPSFPTQSMVPYEPWMDPAFWPRFADAWSYHLDDKQALFFEISDLVQSLLNQSRLSGILRIQVEILCNLLGALHPKPVHLTVQEMGGGLVKVETQALLGVIDHLRTGAKSGAEIESDVRELLKNSVPFTVRRRDIFLTSGAFWSVSGTGALLQSVKNCGAIIGVFIHDITPFAAPEFFEPGSTRRFAKGVAEALTFADFILTSSEYNKTFLAKHLGRARESLPVHVVPLGHACSLTIPSKTGISVPFAGILDTEYVLCTDEIGVRNNPTYLFNIWKLMKRSGRPNVPSLVFAGEPGWLGENFMRQLEACNYLDGLIVVLQDATDVELDSLYRNCLLTAFPSFIDGWALPVGESLSRGKICLCSSEGGIPEVGGDLADYVDPYNVRDGLQRLLRYLDDPELRQDRELQIAQRFRSRSWQKAADHFQKSIQMLADQAQPFEGIAAVVLPPGRFVPISSETPAICVDWMGEVHSAELACISGWYPPEAAGVRASQPTATLRFRTNAPVGTRVNLILRLAADGGDSRIRISASSGAQTDVSIADGSTQVAVLSVAVEPEQLVIAQLQSPGSCAWLLKGILYFASKGATNGA